MKENNLTIKRLYDQYNQKDFDYSREDSVNLNPKREVSFEHLDRITKKLQEITDDIILKRIAPPAASKEFFEHALSGETFPRGIPIKKQIMLAQTGGIGNALLFPVINNNLIGSHLLGSKVVPPALAPHGPLDKLLEEIIGLCPMPDMLDELDKPLALDCEYILKKFDFDDDDSDDDIAIPTDFGGDGSDSDSEDSDGSGDGDGDGNDDGSGDGGPGGDDDTGNSLGDGLNDDSGGDDDWDETPEEQMEREMRECTEIELTWLKMLLILVKLLQILKMIIELIMAILFPLIDILHLAVGAWLNPPNIPLILQKIAEVVVGIILKLIALITQMIWDLLNFDCVAQQTADVIEQIRRAISVFKSLTNAFNPTAINMLANKLKDDIMNPLEAVLNDAKAKKEAWAEFGAQMKDMFTNGVDLKKASQQAMNSIVDGVKGGLPGTLGPYADTLNNLKNQATKMGQEAQEAFNSMKDAKQDWSQAAAAMRRNNSSENAMLSDPNIIIDETG